MDFTQDLNNIFEKIMECAKPVTEETDTTKLFSSLINLDNSFNSLLGQFLLVPIHESNEADKKEIDNSYQNFFDNLKLSAELMIQFFKKYMNNIDYKDNGFIELLEKKFKDSKEAYDAVILKSTQNIDAEYQKRIKLLNDSYFAYVYLLRTLNSMIDTYNKQHPNATIKMIDNVPEPNSLDSFSDKNTEEFIQNFINQLYVEHSYSKCYLNGILKAIKGALKYACYDVNFINHNPADGIEFRFDIPPGGYQNEKEDTTIKPEIESARPCYLCEHDNAKDNTCIYCNTEHRCWSRKQ